MTSPISQPPGWLEFGTLQWHLYHKLHQRSFLLDIEGNAVSGTSHPFGSYLRSLVSNCHMWFACSELWKYHAVTLHARGCSNIEKDVQQNWMEPYIRCSVICSTADIVKLSPNSLFFENLHPTQPCQGIKKSVTFWSIIKWKITFYAVNSFFFLRYKPWLVSDHVRRTKGFKSLINYNHL